MQGDCKGFDSPRVHNDEALTSPVTGGHVWRSRLLNGGASEVSDTHHYKPVWGSLESPRPCQGRERGFKSRHWRTVSPFCPGSTNERSNWVGSSPIRPMAGRFSYKEVMGVRFSHRVRSWNGHGTVRAGEIRCAVGQCSPVLTLHLDHQGVVRRGTTGASTTTIPGCTSAWCLNPNGSGRGCDPRGSGFDSRQAPQASSERRTAQVAVTHPSSDIPGSTPGWRTTDTRRKG